MKSIFRYFLISSFVITAVSTQANPLLQAWQATQNFSKAVLDARYTPWIAGAGALIGAGNMIQGANQWVKANNRGRVCKKNSITDKWVVDTKNKNNQKIEIERKLGKATCIVGTTLMLASGTVLYLSCKKK